MINQNENESRLAYLLRVTVQYLKQHGDKTIGYDGTHCDGSCLADDLKIELDGLIDSEDRQRRIAGALGYSKPCTKEQHARPRRPEVMPPEFCPKCHRHLDTAPDHAARGHRVSCQLCSIHATGDTVEEACHRLHAVFGPKPFSAPCPRCTHPLTERPLERVAAPSFVKITCPYCLLQSAGETRDEALGFMATNAKLAPNGYDKKPYTPPPCLCETGFNPECPVHSVSIHTAEEFRLECGPNCHHTPEEHQAFDIGVDMGERDPEAENPCRKFTNPREDLIEAWEAGKSVGVKNREDAEGKGLKYA